MSSKHLDLHLECWQLRELFHASFWLTCILLDSLGQKGSSSWLCTCFYLHPNQLNILVCPTLTMLIRSLQSTRSHACRMSCINTSQQRWISSSSPRHRGTFKDEDGLQIYHERKILPWAGLILHGHPIMLNPTDCAPPDPDTPRNSYTRWWLTQAHTNTSYPL